MIIFPSPLSARVSSVSHSTLLSLQPWLSVMQVALFPSIRMLEYFPYCSNIGWLLIFHPSLLALNVINNYHNMLYLISSIGMSILWPENTWLKYRALTRSLYKYVYNIFNYVIIDWPPKGVSKLCPTLKPYFFFSGESFGNCFGMYARCFIAACYNAMW